MRPRSAGLPIEQPKEIIMGKKLFNMARVEETATFIAAELKTLLDRNYDSHMSRRIREACPTYHNGLTNGEGLLAKLRALSMAQLELTAELGGMKRDLDTMFDDDDEEEVAA
jgi:hypothetical protein